MTRLVPIRLMNSHGHQLVERPLEQSVGHLPVEGHALTRIKVMLGCITGRELVVLYGIFSEERILINYKIILGNMPQSFGISTVIL